MKHSSLTYNLDMDFIVSLSIVILQEKDARVKLLSGRSEWLGVILGVCDDLSSCGENAILDINVSDWMFVVCVSRYSYYILLKRKTTVKY